MACRFTPIRAASSLWDNPFVLRAALRLQRTCSLFSVIQVSFAAVVGIEGMLPQCSNVIFGLKKVNYNIPRSFRTKVDRDVLPEPSIPRPSARRSHSERQVRATKSEFGRFPSTTFAFGGGPGHRMQRASNIRGNGCGGPGGRVREPQGSPVSARRP